MSTISRDNKPEPFDLLPRERFDFAPYGHDGWCYVRALTQGEERQGMTFNDRGHVGGAEFNAYVASVALVDESGAAIFTDKELQQFPGRLCRDATEAALRLSGNAPDENDDDEDAAGNASGGAATRT